MQYKKYLQGLTLACLAVCITACKTTLKDEPVTASGPAGISEYWTMSNAAAGDDNVILAGAEDALISKFTAQNFNMNIKLKTTRGAEGYLAFHTSGAGAARQEGYSIYINNSDYRSGNAQKTGSLSLIRNFYVRMTEDDVWFDLGLSVRGNHITVTVNGKVVSEYYEPENPLRLTGLEGMVLSEGSIVLGKITGDGSIQVSEITIGALPGDLPWQAENFETVDEVSEQITMLNQEGFPFIDFHGHLKNVISFDEITKYGRDHGFNYGVSENCGLDFPVTDDASLKAYYNEVIDEPVFKAMQCEGREWITLFSPEPIAGFDFIFTDALTFTDHKGRRMRLWMPDEVYVDNEEQFMEMLVDKIISIFSQEPVDIYVNPSFLPEVIRQNYDRLWTVERMDRVIGTLLENDVALEINARYRIPGMEFIKRAKAAGVQFTLGTNNAGAHDLGRLEYCIEAIREAGLTSDDMWLPRPAGQKKVVFMGLPGEITG